MRGKKCIIKTFMVVLYISGTAAGVPPFLWYSTYSIENYVGNGCECDTIYANGLWLLSCPNLEFSHDEAAAFNVAVANQGISNSRYCYNRQDNAVTAVRWVGQTAEINGADVLFYSGHGTGFGPTLGCTSAYNAICYDIKFGGSGYLKWVQASACQWFCPAQYANGVGVFSRWEGSFQGVHTVQGHRALAYDMSNSQALLNDFWNDWVYSGESIDEAWKSAQAEFMYIDGARPGLEPATMAVDISYGMETWSSASDDPAPAQAAWLSWRTIGNPEYRDFE